MRGEKKPLTVRGIEAIKKPGLYPDHGHKGLYFRFTETGGRSWVFRYYPKGKIRSMGLGAYPLVTLAEARDMSIDCRRDLKAGRDPIDLRRAKQAEARTVVTNTPTFAECARRFIADNEAGWKNDKHVAQWESTLTKIAGPVIGDLPVNEVSTQHILLILEPIWTSKTETAERLRGRIERVLGWATTRQHRSGENPAAWKGHLDTILPAPSAVKVVKPHQSLPYGQIYSFMTKLRARESTAAKGLELLVLTALRTTEVMGAEWPEIDFDARIWNVPGSRMKMKRDHQVPLTPAAIDLLKSMPVVDGSRYIFPGQKAHKPLSNMAFKNVMNRMGYGEWTPHGFRSSFRNWAAEMTNVQSEVAEMALAHKVGSKTEQAYLRTKLLDKRRGLMSAWSDYCCTPPAAKSAKVIELQAIEEGA